jgi:hypothetical protein
MINKVLNRHVVFCVCVVFALASFYCSRWVIKEGNLNLFASSGAVISLLGLLLTIKHTTIFLSSLPLEQAYRIRCSEAGVFGAANPSPASDESDGRPHVRRSDEQSAVAARRRSARDSDAMLGLSR